MEIVTKAAAAFVEEYPEMSPVTSMVAEAQSSIGKETDMALAAEQVNVAASTYKGFDVSVATSSGEFSLRHEVPEVMAWGPIFKRTRLADGVDFEHLSDEGEHNADYKTAIAKAMVVTQLVAIFEGRPVDHDRHGGNIKVIPLDDGTGDQRAISHFDFGAMPLVLSLIHI